MPNYLGGGSGGGSGRGGGPARQGSDFRPHAESEAGARVAIQPWIQLAARQRRLDWSAQTELQRATRTTEVSIVD